MSSDNINRTDRGTWRGSPDGKPALREHGGAVPGAATLAVRSDLLDPDAPRSVAVDNFEIYGSWESQFPPR